MKRNWWWVLPALAILAWNANPSKAEDKKGIKVNLDGLESAVPADWKQEETTNKMRAFQFRLPKVEGDKEDGELVIFYFGPGGGGSVKDNINRWKGMFVAPQGKTIDEVATVTPMKVGDVNVTYLDVQGTYKYKAQPFNPNAKEELRPNSRMLGVVFESKKGPYFIRAVGPAKTVTHHKKGFDDWLKAFK